MSWVYVYLLAFQVTLAKCQLITEESWRQTYLDPEDTFANHSIMSAYSRLECAAKALSLEWPNLFCYDSPKKECLLSDLVTISAQKTSEDQVSCLTRFNDNKVCRNEQNKSLATPEGGTLKVGLCIEKKCVGGTFLEPESLCDPFFDIIEQFGCLLVVQELSSWTVARQVCKQKNLLSDLVTIDTVERQEAFKQYLLSKGIVNHVWTGLYQNATSNGFKFVTGETMDPSIWAYYAPNDGSGDLCARIRPDYAYTMDDIACTNEFFFACQIPC